jgi:hypothetical protein
VWFFWNVAGSRASVSKLSGSRSRSSSARTCAPACPNHRHHCTRFSGSIAARERAGGGAGDPHDLRFLARGRVGGWSGDQ